MIRHLGLFAAVVLFLSFPATTTLEAANKEHQQMMADIRMLQQQNTRLQAQLAAVTKLLESVTARLEEQSAASRKSFADQKAVADTMTADLRVLRERIDESNVRLGSLSEEVEGIRLAQAAAPATAVPAPGDPAAGQPTPPASRPGGFGASASQAFETARSDYYMGNWSLAIQGFESFLRTFQKSDLTDDAQYYIGETCYMSGRFQDALAAYNAVIERYPTSNTLPDAYFKRGMALKALGQVPQAKDSLSFVIRTYPSSDAAFLAKQALDQLNVPKK
jgi:tol-pal system protein YbgF